MTHKLNQEETETVSLTVTNAFAEVCELVSKDIEKIQSAPSITDIDTLGNNLDVWDAGKQTLKYLNDIHKALKRPLQDKISLINTLFKPLTENLEAELKTQSAKIIDWQSRNNPETRSLRTETAQASLRHNPPSLVVTDKEAFVKAILSKAKGRADLTLKLIDINAGELRKLGRTYIKGQEVVKKLPPGTEVEYKPDSLV